MRGAPTLRKAAVLAAAGAALLCALVFAGYLYFSGTSSFQDLMLPRLDFAPLQGRDVFTLLCTWATLLATVLLTLAIRRMTTHNSNASRDDAIGLTLQVKRLMAWQLPPHAFFAAWCGGLSVAEAIGVLGWVCMNVVWLTAGLRSVLGDPLATSWQDQLNGAAKLFGQMIAPNLMLLFLPIPHTNCITWLTGVSRNRLIRFHRWLGQGTLWVVTTHSLLYYAYWAATASFWVNFKDWGTLSVVNNLAGSLAFFSVLVLWATSMSYVRRRFYELFFRCHIICFISFFLLSCAHYAQCWMYFAPGLLLYAADLALRAGQMSNLTTAMQHRPLSEVWLLIPGLSRWQWHPFSVASGGGSTLKLHIKQYGRFTKKLLGSLRQHRPLAVRLSGPMGSEVTAGCQLTPMPAWHSHEVVVMVCGGVGVTGMLSMLRAMAAHYAAAVAGDADDVDAPGLPRRVVCVWAARQATDFLALDAPLLLAATAHCSWLDLRLHLTDGSSPSLRGRDTDSHTVPAPAQLPSKAASLGGSVLPVNHHSPAPGTAVAPVRIGGASPYWWSLLRPAQPLAFGTLHLAVVYVLTFFGGFCGVLIGTSYLEIANQWQAGMLTCALLSSMALGLPFGLAIFPLHAIRYWVASSEVRAGAPAGKGQAVACYSQQATLSGQSCVLAGGAVALPGSRVAVQVMRGRPDVEAVLRATAGDSAAATVGLYVGGPAPLMQAIHLTVCRLNGEGTGTYFELHNESVEL